MTTKIHKYLALSLFIGGFLFLQACDAVQNHTKLDRDTNTSAQDNRDAFAPREVDMADQNASAATDVPDFENYVVDSAQNLRPMPLVSVSVNQTIPLRDVLFELAKQADYDIELDPRIQGSIIFTARNRPLDVVIDRIAEIAGLRYKMDESSLRVELDTPYTKHYRVDFFGVKRKSSSSMGVSGKLASAGGDSGGGSGGGTNGSEFSVDMENEVDTWAELESNLKQILDSNAEPHLLKTSSDPAISASQEGGTDVVPPVPPIDENQVMPQPGDVTSGFKSTVSVPSASVSSAQATPTPAPAPASTPASTASPTTDAAATPEAAAATPQQGAQAEQPAAEATPPTPVLEVGSLPTGPTDTNGVSFTPGYSINKQAGIVTVYANERIHKKVQEYLDLMQKAISSQVLIEAKVLEVTLNDQNATGINWSALNLTNLPLSLTMAATRPSGTFNGATGATLNIATGEDLNAVIQAVSSFGTVHALASPRLTVMNNQSAVLNVARNLVYFEVDTTVTTTDTSTNENTETEIKTVPEGVTINVTPTISPDLRDITLTVRPTVSVREISVEDPSNPDNLIPQMAIREFDSVLKMKTGEVAVLGGLLNDRVSQDQGGFPVLGETPLFGALFRNKDDVISKTELVVLIRATVLNTASDSIHNTDREIYRIYSQDRRPFPIR